MVYLDVMCIVIIIVCILMLVFILFSVILCWFNGE